jgi:glyoxylate/hydroxypyruvate reductase A
VIVMPALIDALQSGRLGGAVLDVEDSGVAASVAGLWSCPNLIALPHCLSNDPDQFMANVLDIFVENLQRFIHGEELRNLVQLERNY